MNECPEAWGKMVILNPEVLNKLDALEPAVKRAVASNLAQSLMETQRKIIEECKQETK